MKKTTIPQQAVVFGSDLIATPSIKIANIREASVFNRAFALQIRFVIE